MLEKGVDHLDLGGPGAEARDCVDEPLKAVVGLDHLFGRAFAEDVRLVVDDERPPALALEHVEPAVHQHPVVQERERPLGQRPGEPGDAPGKRRVAVGTDERGDPVELVVATPAGTTSARPSVGENVDRGDRRARGGGAPRRRSRWRRAPGPRQSAAARAGPRHARRRNGTSIVRRGPVPSTRAAGHGGAAAAAPARVRGAASRGRAARWGSSSKRESWASGRPPVRPLQPGRR